MAYNAITKEQYLKNNPSIESVFATDEKLAEAVYTQSVKNKVFLTENYTYEEFKEDFLQEETPLDVMPSVDRPLNLFPTIGAKKGFLTDGLGEEIIQVAGSTAEKLDRAGEDILSTGVGLKNFALSPFRSEEENVERKIEKEAEREQAELDRLTVPYVPSGRFNLSRSPLKDIAYLANKIVGDNLKPRGDLSKIRKVHEIAVKEGRYKGTWEEFLNDPKGITTKYGLNKTVLAVDALPEQFKQDLVEGIIPENETELSNFVLEGTRPTSKLGRLTSFAVGDIAPFIVGTTKLKAGADMFVRAPKWLKQADNYIEKVKKSSKLSKRFWGTLAKGGVNFARYAPSAEITAQVLLNPYEDRLSKILGGMMAQDDGLANDIISFLSTDDSDSELEARLEMALEGVVTWVGLSAGLKTAGVAAISTLKNVKKAGEKTVAVFISRTINPHYKGRAAEIRDANGKLLPEKVEQFAILHNPSEGRLGNFLHKMMGNAILPVLKTGGSLSRQATIIKQNAENAMAGDNYGIEKTVKHLGEEIDNLKVKT